MKDMSPIETYINECLSPLLSSLGVSKTFLIECISNVRMQVYSFCAHWNDVEFRNGLFVIGLEEGMFYEPEKPINPFVVVSIRDSLLETLQSVDCHKAGLSASLEDGFVKTITKQAIEYFGCIDMEEACAHISIEPSSDLYGIAARSHPIAWTALKKIGNVASSIVTYEPVADSHDSDFFGRLLGDVNNLRNTPDCDVSDGYSPEIDGHLQSAMNAVVSQGVLFSVESFKALTRNFEKLLHVMEYVLCNRSAFVTCNYYIANGYVTRRSPLLRPGHTSADARKNLENLMGLRKTHREALCDILRQ